MSRRHALHACHLAAALTFAAAVLAACSSGSHHPAAPTPTTNAPLTRFVLGTAKERLPLSLPTDGATQVITVSSPTLRSTTATLQAWERTSGGWSPFGPSITAHVGNSGITPNERESLTASPMGSFSLTEAFGRLPDPGTRLPYTQTNPNSWWISQPGPMYNTYQSCMAQCPFNTGSPNARLYYVSPQYNLAVVIDYNRNPVRQGAGSGIFLHVTSGRPTAGCVSIPMPQLVQLMRWLNPTKHPRIMIGLAPNRPTGTPSATATSSG